MWYDSGDRTTVYGHISGTERSRAMSALANVVLEWRKNKGLGHNEAAQEIGISPSTLTNMVKKKGPLPRPATIRKLARAMDVDPSLLTALLGYPVNSETQPSERALIIARQLEAFPWLLERWEDLTKLSRRQFNELMDHFEFRRRRWEAENGDQSRA